MNCTETNTGNDNAQSKGCTMTAHRTPRQGDVWVNPYTNQEVHQSDPQAKLRHYLSGPVADMIRKWGRVKDDAARTRASEIVAELANRRNTEIFECFYLDDRNYMAFVFADEIDRGSAWLNGGFVDHADQTEWCAASPKNGVWRTYLPTGHGSGGRVVETWRIETVKCPNCLGMTLSVTATCGCGWSAAGAPADYDDLTG